MLRLAARYADGFNWGPWSSTPNKVRHGYPRLATACREIGRVPNTLMLSTCVEVLMIGPEATTAGRFRDEIVAQLNAFSAAGAHHLVCALQPLTLASIERFGEVISSWRQIESVG